MRARTCLVGTLLSVASGCGFIGSGNAAVLTSSNFSIGYGFTQNASTGWNTSETNATNTYLPSGDFSLSINLSAPPLTASGPTFIGGVLGNTTGTSYAAYTQGTAHNFQVSALSSYTGSLPIGATNIQMQLTITSISVYVGRIGAGSTESPDSGNAANFLELTPGHGASQSPIILTAFTNIGLASDYSLLSWDPDDFENSGTSQTRTFSVDAIGNGLQRVVIDGFKIDGFITMTYDVVPEPRTAILLGIALSIGFLMKGRFRESCA